MIIVVYSVDMYTVRTLLYTVGVAQIFCIILRTELQVPYRSGINAAKFQRKIMTATPGKCRFMFALKQFYE